MALVAWQNFGSNTSVAAAPVMGLRRWNANLGSPTGIWPQTISDVSGWQRRKRPSHDARRWARHYTRWGDRMVPMPFARGIPFRGDCFGGMWYGAANIDPTGA